MIPFGTIWRLGEGSPWRRSRAKGHVVERDLVHGAAKVDGPRGAAEGDTDRNEHIESPGRIPESRGCGRQEKHCKNVSGRVHVVIDGDRTALVDRALEERETGREAGSDIQGCRRVGQKEHGRVWRGLVSDTARAACVRVDNRQGIRAEGDPQFAPCAGIIEVADRGEVSHAFEIQCRDCLRRCRSRQCGRSEKGRCQ